MASLDLRSCLNAVSDVVSNRPRPIREFDQIFMKTADMLFQTEHVSRYFDKKNVVFIGDGDAIGLCLVHLHQKNLIKNGPARIHVLDFDERVVLSIQHFAQQYRIEKRVTAELYNVADPLPKKHWHRFNAFYTNPPFGQRNDGRSIEAFMLRGMEAVGNDAVACAVIADDRRFPWTHELLLKTQKFAHLNQFAVCELLPEFHLYHLDDVPDLRSCSMLLRRSRYVAGKYSSRPLEKSMLKNFYGKEAPLRVRFIRDLTNGGKLASRDYKMERL